jgi:hypothetical protein
VRAAATAAAAGHDRSGKAGLTAVIAALPHVTNLSLSLQGLGPLDGLQQQQSWLQQQASLGSSCEHVG